MAETWDIYLYDKMRFQSTFSVIWQIKSNIRAPVLLIVLQLFEKAIKCHVSLTFNIFSPTL